MIGAIVADFDALSRPENYFDLIDEGGWRAAKEVFPDLPIERILNGWNIQQRAALNFLAAALTLLLALNHA